MLVGVLERQEKEENGFNGDAGETSSNLCFSTRWMGVFTAGTVL